jgi:hypothetical protein
MGVVHNFFLRGLNSIYLQAPYVHPADYADFVAYASCFYPSVFHHHDGEETRVFPQIEALVGQPGVMDINVEQHKVFHDGMENMRDYLSSLAGKESEFDGKKLVAIIDSFGPALHEHLVAEVQFIDDLRRFGDRLTGIAKIMDAEGEKAVGGMPKTTQLAFCFLNHDIDYEDGRWAGFPEAAPKLIVWAIKNVFTCWHAKWWKFASCDSSGRLKPLYAGPPAGK